MQATRATGKLGQIIGGVSCRSIVVNDHDRRFFIDLKATDGLIELRRQRNE
jgi:hypothetical protein